MTTDYSSESEFLDQIAAEAERDLVLEVGRYPRNTSADALFFGLTVAIGILLYSWGRSKEQE